MTPQMIGLLAGAVFGLVSFGLLRWIADRTEGMKPTPQQKRSADLLRIVGWFDVMIFPVLGYFIVPMVMR